MANRPALDAEGLEALAAAINRGESLSATAAALGVSYKTVQKAAKRLGLRVSTKRARPVYGKEIREVVLARCRARQETAGAIARSLGVSDTWVQSLAKTAGIAMPVTSKLSHQVDEIAARYQSGESGAQIAKSLNVTDVAVLARLRRHGVEIREPGTVNRRWPLRHDAFADMENPEAAYWAGFLLADGTIAKSGRVTLALKETDRHHIQAWLDFLGAGATPVRIDSPKARAQVSSRRLSGDLIRHGLVVRKTYADAPASEVLASQASFWRGMVDGDGTIMPPKGKHGPVLSLVGSAKVMEQYATFVSAVLGGYRPRVLPTSSEVLRLVKVEGRPARQVIRVLWADVLDPGDATRAERPGPALERKLDRVANAIRWRTKTEFATEVGA